MEYVGVPDVPEGMTLAEYRRLRCSVPRTRRARLLARLRRRRGAEDYASTSPRRIA
jgi:hypothetical protein